MPEESGLDCDQHEKTPWSTGPGVGGCKCRRLACGALVPGVFSGSGYHVILLA